MVPLSRKFSDVAERASRGLRGPGEDSDGPGRAKDRSNGPPEVVRRASEASRSATGSLKGLMSELGTSGGA